MFVMICGDWHGDLPWADLCLRTARENGIDTILQLGDNGFVWRTDRTDGLEVVAREHGVHVAFLPGNHEGWEILDQCEKGRPDGAEYEQGPLGGYLLQQHVEYLGRVHRFELGGRTFLSVGGAVSVDKAMRSPYISWWPQEETTDLDVLRAIKDGPVEVLLTHDAPANETLEAALSGNGWYLAAKLESESLANRTRIRDIYNAVTPKLAFHGHFHHAYVHHNIIGLHCDGDRRNAVVLDTETLEPRAIGNAYAGWPR